MEISFRSLWCSPVLFVTTKIRFCLPFTVCIWAWNCACRYFLNISEAYFEPFLINLLPFFLSLVRINIVSCFEICDSKCFQLRLICWIVFWSFLFLAFLFIEYFSNPAKGTSYVKYMFICRRGLIKYVFVISCAFDWNTEEVFIAES